MTASRLTIRFIFAAAAVSQLACASHSGAVKDAGPQIALRRGGSISTYAVNLPSVSGSTAQLRLEGQMLQGFVGSGSVHVRIDDDKASGFGPSGSIDVRIQQQAGALIVDGLWNSGPVHLIFGATWLKGTVARWGGNVPRPAICGYDLDHLDQGGSFVGTSTCEGLPQRTRLELDERISRHLRPSELAVLLVTILASPGPG